MRTDLYDVARQVARIFQHEDHLKPGAELTADDLCARIVIARGPSRFNAPRGSMLECLAHMREGGHLDVRKSRTNHYRLGAEVRRRPPLPDGWFLRTHAFGGNEPRREPVVQTDVGFPELFLLMREGGAAGNGAFELGAYPMRWADFRDDWDGRRHNAEVDRRLAFFPGFRRERGSVYGPWTDAASARLVAEVVAGTRER